MDFIQIAIITIAEFLVAIFSSIAQGGGNYIIMPILLGVGLTPVAASAALSVSNLGFTAGHIAGLKDVKVRDKQALAVLLVTGSITGLFVPYILVRMSGDIYSLIIGAFLLITAPILYKKPFKPNPTAPSNKSRIKGYILLTVLFIVARFTLGIGALFTFALCHYCGHTVLEANLSRKVSGLLNSIIVSAGVILAGFVNWPVTISLTVGSIMGAYIGARITVRKGNQWTAKIMVLSMLVSGIALIVLNI